MRSNSRLATITARTLGIILALAFFVGLYLVVNPWGGGK